MLLLIRSITMVIILIQANLVAADEAACSKYDSLNTKIAKYRSYKEKLIEARDKNKHYLSTLEDHHVSERRKAIENISIAEMRIEAASNMIEANSTQITQVDASGCNDARRSIASEPAFVTGPAAKPKQPTPQSKPELK